MWGGEGADGVLSDFFKEGKSSIIGGSGEGNDKIRGFLSGLARSGEKINVKGKEDMEDTENMKDVEDMKVTQDVEDMEESNVNEILMFCNIE